MKSLSPLALNSVFLYQATLLQYARYVAANNLSTTCTPLPLSLTFQLVLTESLVHQPTLPEPIVPTPSIPSISTQGAGTRGPDVIPPEPPRCPGCAVVVMRDTLTYPGDVSLDLQTVTATVIPYVTVYADGSKSTSFSTVDTSSSQFQEPSNTPLTWFTYGTALTYPTTYLAFPSPLAGFAQEFVFDNTSVCEVLAYTPVPIPTAQLSNLIFPADSPARITHEVFGYLDSLPTITAIVGGVDPRSCSQTIGQPPIPFMTLTTVAASVPPAPPPPLPFSHTSVAVLTQIGKPVTTSVPSLPDTNAHGPQGGDGDNGGSGNGDNNGGNGNNNGGGNGENNGGGNGENNGGGNGENNGGNGGGNSGGNGNNGGNGGGNNGGNGGSNSGTNGGTGGTTGGTNNGGTNGGGGSEGGIAPIILSALSQYDETPAPTSQAVHIGASNVPVANGPNGAVIVAGQTLAPGATTVVNGVTVAHPSSGSAIVVGGTASVTITASNQPARSSPALDTSAAGLGSSVSVIGLLLGVAVGVAGAWL